MIQARNTADSNAYIQYTYYSKSFLHTVGETVTIIETELPELRAVYYNYPLFTPDNTTLSRETSIHLSFCLISKSSVELVSYTCSVSGDFVMHSSVAKR
jgi:hypothetical protein